jgi:alcohol dehydrogenase class IV
VAKCIKLAVLAKEGNAAIIPPLVNTRVACDGAKLPFIAIPTTAGTGSESTHNAVMYYEGAKQTVTNDGVLPDYAILEPSVLKTLPLYQKKCTMLDALCPAERALSDALEEGATLKEALGKAVDAAEAGLAHTKDIIATKGRASYLGERSLGHQDPGATSSLLMLQVMEAAL